MTFKKWDSIEIETDDGETVTGIAPIIISASRSTDIPSFHAEWFIDRLCNAKYVKWINPFNRTPQYVSFKKTRVIVFWTKNAKPILPLLDKIDSENINYYFQFTLNDYEKEGLEPFVPKLEERISTFKKLSKKIGKEKVIWRFDPLILSEKTSVENLLEKISRVGSAFDPLILSGKISVEDLLEKIYKVGSEIHDYTNKLVISFADIEPYAKVKRNLKKAGVEYRDFDIDSMDQIAKGIQKINNDNEWGLEIATCAEERSFDKYNINHNKCIDDELMKRIFRDDDELMCFLRDNESKPIKVKPIKVNADLSSYGGGSKPKNNGLKDGSKPKNNGLKDKGQRKQCGCIVSKDIGQYNTCGHLCVYCYANYSEKVVRKNLAEKCSENGDSILTEVLNTQVKKTITLPKERER